MKRLALAALALLAFSALPSQGSDIGNLQPVGLLYIYWKDGMICTQTDAGDYGQGGDLQSALQDMEASSPKEIFLETTEELIVTESVQALLPQLQRILRPGTQVYLGSAELNPETAYEYLSAKKEGVLLKDWQKGTHLPILRFAEGRFRIA